MTSCYWLLCHNLIHHKINERRRRDLNPRAGHPTYTLSRGASSASWVLLPGTEFNPLPILSCAFSLDANLIIHIMDISVNYFFTIYLNFLFLMDKIIFFLQPIFLYRSSSARFLYSLRHLVAICLYTDLWVSIFTSCRQSIFRWSCVARIFLSR